MATDKKINLLILAGCLLGAADVKGLVFAKGEADKEEHQNKVRRARGE